MIKVLAFDFDGVILESVAVKDQAIFELFENASLEERQQVLDLHRKTPGIKRWDRIHMLLTQGLDMEVPNYLVDSYLERFSKLVWEGLMDSVEVPGIRKFLNEVFRQIQCYIVSAAPQYEVRAVAETRDFSKYFVDILGSPFSKVEILEQIIENENVNPNSLIMIGDKPTDYKAAMTVGSEFIGRLSPDNMTNFPEDVLVIKDFRNASFLL